MENTLKNDKDKSFELPLSILCRWLKMLHDKTKNDDIEHALRTIQFVPLTDEERNIIITIRELYMAEMNGYLNPPPSMRVLYENIDQYIND